VGRFFCQILCCFLRQFFRCLFVYQYLGKRIAAWNVWIWNFSNVFYCSLVDRHRCLSETENEGKSPMKILITLSLTTRFHIPQDSSFQSYCRENIQCHMFQLFFLLCLIFLGVVLVCQTFPSDAAERELFQVTFSAGDMGWRTKKPSSFPGRGQGHRYFLFLGKVAWARCWPHIHILCWG